MELTTLRYFRAIAAAGHMTRAADTLGITQPALSAMLRKLEEEVGAPLFDRTGKGMELTEAGRIFLRHADETLRNAQAGVDAVQQLVGLHRGSIRVGGGATATTYLLPAVVGQVRAQHPGLRFYIREAGSSAVAQAVLAGELDIGIVTLPITTAGADRLVRIPLVQDELRLIVPPAHRLAATKSSPATFRWKDLEREPFVAFEAGSAVRELIDRAAAEAGVGLDVVMELRSIESIKSMVAAGIGVGVVSRFALAEDEGLACRDGRLRRSLAIVRSGERTPSAAVAAFEKAVVGAFGPGGRGKAAQRARRS